MAYPAGQCTYYVASVLSWIPTTWGNAATWLQNAEQAGLQTGGTPTVGAVGVIAANAHTAQGTASPEGHVGVIAAVNGDQVTLDSENWPEEDNQANGLVFNVSDFAGFIYPPSGAAVPNTASLLGYSPVPTSDSGVTWDQLPSAFQAWLPLAMTMGVRAPYTSAQVATQWNSMTAAERAVWILDYNNNSGAKQGSGQGSTGWEADVASWISTAGQNILKGGEVVLGAAVLGLAGWVLLSMARGVPGPIKVGKTLGKTGIKAAAL